MDDLISEFVTECTESLGLLDQEMVRFEQNPNDAGILSNIFRVMHTIKGTCGFLGLGRLEKVAHAGEDVLGKFRDGALPVTSEAVSLILECLDRIRTLIEALAETGNEPAGDDSAIISQLRAMAEGKAPAPAAAAPAAAPAAAATAATTTATDGGFPVAAELLEECAAAEGDFPVAAELLAEVAAAEQTAPAAAAPAPAAVAATPAPAAKAPPQTEARAESNGPGQGAQSIRVTVDVLENLMTLVSEMVLTRNQLLQLARANEGSPFVESVQRLSRVTSELQEGVMKTRMQPIGNAWNKLPRIVRDLANELGKKIDLVMSGEETELDRQVLELIKDPLTHMVRNSADHGLERPADRTAAGKGDVGTIKLSAFHEGGHIIIEIADDGRGLNAEKIKAKILEKGLATPDELSRMSEADIQAFIMKPGFSTAEKITNVSGRGVGMDVVRSNIEKIGGTIQFVSTYGKDSTFTIKIPLTLAIVSALIVKSRNDRFAIPQIAVQEVVRASARSEYRIETLKGAPVLRLRNRLLPLVDLASTLTVSDTPMNEGYVVVCKQGGSLFGVVVDSISDAEEIVVKPLSSLIKNTPFYSGNTILGDGSVILILDTNGLASRLGAGVKTVETANVVSETRKDVRNILLFKAGQGLKAVPLSEVHRIEHFDMTKVEYVQGQATIQYRGRLLNLATLAGSEGIRTQGHQTVLVFGSDENQAGLAIDTIVDIIEDELVVARKSTAAGLLGSGIVGGKAVDFIHTPYFLAEAATHIETSSNTIAFGEAA
ncbi:MAG: chemotaxis protein CheA [Rhodospirillaceae bacterium]|nr:chemotaxis protein CheA [Rhodospirillaceae bacterium]